MKTNKLFGLAALACGFAMSFTSCNNVDNPVLPPEEPEITIGFEDVTLNADGYWCGDKTGTLFSNYGQDAYACSYSEAGVTFLANYTPAYPSWSGYAVSNRTATTYASATMTPDQFNNITGKAHSGNNFCVVFPFGETINFGKPVTVKGFWYTNSSWVVDAILNGDGMSPGKFEANDWFKCQITNGETDNEKKVVYYEFDLAKDGDYVKTWQYCDLSGVEAFKNITSFGFGFEGTKKNDYGVTTPTYICIDDIVIEYEK